MHRFKIAIVHPQLGWGGSEAVALWALAALKDDYDVCLITSGSVDILHLNEYYGTNLDPKEFAILQVPLPLGLRNTTRFAALRWRFIQRYCQRMASSFDLMISAYNPFVFGVKGIQLVADLEELSTILPLRNWKRWWYGNTPLRKAYLKVCDWISPASPEVWKDNLTLANSNWTAELLRRRYGVEARVLYPPVPDHLHTIPYGEREKGFVCIGRIVPEKRIEAVIEVLGRVRERGHIVHLHVVGGAAGNSHYARVLKKHCLKHHLEWVSFEGRLSEQTKKELTARHRFGISARKNEPFGIVVAEMVQAGCIVFVPDGGGQVEIVDHGDLVYANVEDAVNKIDRVLSNNEVQVTLQEHLAIGAPKFSLENFKEGIEDVVSDFFKERST